MRWLGVLAALLALVGAPLALAKTGGGVTGDPKDTAGKLDLRTVAAGPVKPLLTLTIRTYAPWQSKILQGTKGGSGPLAGPNRLVVLYDTNADGKPDYTGPVVYWKGHLSLWITGHGSAFEPVPVKRPTGASLSFTHPVDVLLKGKKKLRLAVVSVYRQGAACAAHGCRDRAPDHGWISAG